MRKVITNGLHWTMTCLAVLIGAWLGWAACDLSWRVTHPVGVVTLGAPLSRGLDYHFLSACCTLSGATVGLAVARWNELPEGATM